LLKKWQIVKFIQGKMSDIEQTLSDTDINIVILYATQLGLSGW